MASGTGGGTGPSRWAGLLRMRLFHARWLLVVAILSILAVALAGDAPAWVALLAALAVLAVAALQSVRRVPASQAVAAAAPPAVARISALALADAVPEPLIVFDANGLTVHANRAATETFGPLPAGASLRLKFRSPEMQDLLGDALEGKVKRASVDYLERVPLERAFRVFAMPVGDVDGLHVLCFEDQSEARRIDRMRADFIANASHELRTPLASVAGFIDTLRGPARDDLKARDDFLQIMQTQTARMARLIDDLLSLSRLEMKPLNRSGERIDLVELAGSVADALGHLAAEHGVRIERHFPDHPVEVPGGRDELIQVFENLLENACKYGGSGGRVDLIVEEGTHGAGPEAVVTVRDYGPGIPEEHIPRVTERFYRVDIETSRTQKGTGLGLAIVKHILARHGGRLVIRSALGEGSSFSAHLPREWPRE